MRFLPLASLVVCCGSPTPQLAANQLVATRVHSAIRSDGAFIYYLDDAAQGLRLMRMSVSGGAPSVLTVLPAPLDINYMAAFIIDGSSAYCPINGAILSVPLTGGTPIRLVDDSPEMIQALAEDDTSLYWIEGGRINPTITPYADDERLVTMPKIGGLPTVLVSSTNTQVLGQGATQLAVTAGRVFWPGSGCQCSVMNDSILTIPVGGGSPTSWVSGQQNPGAVATDGSSIYWLNAGTTASSGSLISAPLSSALSDTTLAQGIQSPSKPATDQAWNIQVQAANVFWLDATGSGVFGVSDGQVMTFASTTDVIEFFAVDASNVYWATTAGVFFTKLH